MKIAYYLEDGLQQLVLTPETEEEKRLANLFDKYTDLKVYRGSFYSCQGGWMRQRELYHDAFNPEPDHDDESVIFVLKEKKKKWTTLTN